MHRFHDTTQQRKDIIRLTQEAKTRDLTDFEKENFRQTKQLRMTKETSAKMEFIREENITIEDLEDVTRDLWEEREATEHLFDMS